jgi:hypothetical protein
MAYIAFCCIRMRSAIVNGSAPPEPPSPITSATEDVGSALIAAKQSEIEPARPVASSAITSCAPGVSMNMISANCRRSASCIRRRALR